MENTGERLLTEGFNETTIEHLHRYAIALEYTDDKFVLDISSGEGYGTYLIAGNAKKVIGVDISNEAISHAKQKYLKDNIEFKLGSADKIPCPSNYFDVVVSFETIEHHDRHHEMLVEIKRVLKTDGIFIISSPDKLNYTDRPNIINPFHVKELYEAEFKELINKYFKYNQFLKQRLDYLSVIIPENQSIDFECYNGSFDRIQKKIDYGPHYIISISSNFELQHKSFAPLYYGFDILQKNFNDRINYQLNTHNAIINSNRYKIGNIILTPFTILRRFLKKCLKSQS